MANFTNSEISDSKVKYINKILKTFELLFVVQGVADVNMV